ncbi:Ark- serine/threonine protein kinase [Diatrype stigma]|uniref:Ark- serine/threonine protein kinase n=1 Tax=Diatrype stigma TaxID=117547 RepID=A0AAN9YRJ0_9PEZI
MRASRQAEADEIASRFPTLDQFSLLHDQGAKFDFDNPTSPAERRDLTQLVTDHLADDAFARAQSKPDPTQPKPRQSTELNRVRPVVSEVERQVLSPPPGSVNKPASAPPRPPSEMSRASAIISSNPELQAIASSPPKSVQTPSRPSMVSTGTMTQTPPQNYPQIQQFPPTDQHRSSSLPRHQDPVSTDQPRMDTGYQNRPTPTSRLSFQQRPTHARHTSSSRPSLEGARPSLEVLEPLPKSTSGRPRPASTFLESNLEYLREREAAPRPLRSPGLPSTRFPEQAPSPGMEPLEDTAIESNVDFLRSMEDSDPKRKDKAGKHSKRPSLSSLAGTKNIFAGKFGDAFKRFEGNSSSAPARTPSPLKELDRHDLTPIAGSEATDGRSDDGHGLGEPELTPEMRRELEAQSLAEEERRVEAAAAEYRRRVAAREAGEAAAPLPKSIGGVSRAVSIQTRVQNLLDESQKSPVQKTATGYGKFTPEAAAPALPTRPGEKQLPDVPQRLPAGTGRAGPTPPRSAASSAEAIGSTTTTSSTRGRPAQQSGAMVPQDSGTSSRPSLPPRPQPAPKPTHLNSIPTGSGSNSGRARSPPNKQPQRSGAASTGPGPRSSTTELLVGVDLPGRPVLDMTAQEKEDYIQDFSKRFPSLSAIEMVERDLGDIENNGGSGGVSVVDARKTSGR